MAKIIETDALDPKDLTDWERDQVYNGMDACMTLEIFKVLQPQLDNHTAATYQFSKDLQAPVLEMRLRGVKIDKARKAEVIDEYFSTIERLESQLERIVGDGLGLWEFNWRSNPDLHRLFYGVLGIPEIKRGGRATVNRDALEKIEGYFQAQQVVRHILLMRDLQKKISMLKTEIDPDGRMRTSYNIAGTTTGRLSSSFSEFGTGTNLQNIEESLRSIFVADPGMKMAYLDAKSGESFCVGAIIWNLFKEAKYLEACETGDPHTVAARFCFRKLPWTGDLVADKDIAEKPFYRHHSYRDMTKKMGHGTNYMGKPQTLSTMHKIPLPIVQEFQPHYFRAFPGILQWHAWVERQLREFGYLINLTGRKRWFFGRRNDDATLREAIAFDPQGSLADILNRGMLEVWRQRLCQLLMQIHDAILIQYPEQQEDKIIPLIQSQLRVPIQLEGGREFIIPYGVSTGFNWGKYDPITNPDGLKIYEPGNKRKRLPEVSILDRKLRGVKRAS